MAGMPLGGELATGLRDGAARLALAPWTRFFVPRCGSNTSYSAVVTIPWPSSWNLEHRPIGDQLGRDHHRAT